MTTLDRYMTRHPHTVAATKTVDEARTLMLRLGLRHLPVVEKGKFIGVLSERDIAFADRAGAGGKYLSDLMDDRVYAFDVKDPLLDVAEAMAANKIGAVGVLEHGKLTGIFTSVDVCRALIDVLRNPRGPNGGHVVLDHSVDGPG